ncbi:PDZ domain-containing protein [Halalkalibacter sp. AB-rgal2]|uniref:PDZ domain-containing protein n=1 Tax=Halalkalibacter sp. AB-rgal2 TaxID=3242695 RepID=UPI00359E46FA
MVVDILQAIGIFIAYFFANPLLYIGIGMTLFLSYLRIKSERKSFHTRVYGKRADFLIPFLPAFVMGVYVSIVTILIGLTVSIQWLLLVSALYLILAFSLRTRFVTPTYVLGLLLLIYVFTPFFQAFDWFRPIADAIQSTDITSVAILLAVSLMAEGILIRTNGLTHTSPRLEKSKRGKWIGYHDANRLWILPVIAFVPEGMIPTLPFWPILSIGELSLQPIVFPLLIGFQLRVRGFYPPSAIRKYGQLVLLLGLGALVLSIGTYFFSWIALILAIGLIIAREVIIFLFKKRDEDQPPYFSSRPTGCIIVGILPGSPAEKMKLHVGETIRKVNGKLIHNEHDFYERLQVNSAFCKLEVVDLNGEIRFAQTALYDGEHHQIGVLFVNQDHQWQDSI